MKKKAKALKVPKVGDKIYVETHLYIGHGVDDVAGGIATVEAVKMGISAGEETPFVSVVEHPGNAYNWEMLAERQAALKKEFGKQKACQCPDYETPPDPGG